MIAPTDNAIADAMIACGGSFVRSLGQAWHYADPGNKERIKTTWPEYWLEYKHRAAAIKASAAKQEVAA